MGGAGYNLGIIGFGANICSCFYSHPTPVSVREVMSHRKTDDLKKQSKAT